MEGREVPEVLVAPEVLVESAGKVGLEVQVALAGQEQATAVLEGLEESVARVALEGLAETVAAGARVSAFLPTRR